MIRRMTRSPALLAVPLMRRQELPCMGRLILRPPPVLVRLLPAQEVEGGHSQALGFGDGMADEDGAEPECGVIGIEAADEIVGATLRTEHAERRDHPGVHLDDM